MSAQSAGIRPPERTRRARASLLLLVPLALAIAAYRRVLHAPFVWDDEPGILLNPVVRDLGALAPGQLAREMLGTGRPVTDLTFALNHAVGGFVPWSFHATNLAIHLVAVVLVFLFTRRLARLARAAKGDAIAIATAGIFALHPIQTEAVSYVVQRSEVLASGLYVLVVLLLLSAERHGRTWRGGLAWAGALLAYVLAMASKPIAVTAPAAYLLATFAVDRSTEARSELTSWPRRAALVAPFLAIAGGAAVSMLVALRGDVGAGLAVPGLQPLEYLMTELKVIVLYSRLLVWPAGQNVDWDFPVFTSLLQPGVLASGAFLLGLAACGVALVAWGRARAGDAAAAARLAGLGILWFFLLLSVTSSVIPIADLVFEHRLYLASWGVFLALAVGFERLAARLALRPAWVSAIVVGVWCSLAVATWARNAVWEGPEPLWRDAMDKSPEKARPYISLGDALSAQGRYDEAGAVYAAGLERAGGSAFYEAALLGGLGTAQAVAQRWEEAAASFRAALEREPSASEYHAKLGSVLLELGDVAGADFHVRRSLELDPSNPMAWNFLGDVRLAQRDPHGALEALRRANVLGPDLGIVLFNLGRTLRALGRLPDACKAWRDALDLRLGDPARRRTAQLLATDCGTR